MKVSICEMATFRFVKPTLWTFHDLTKWNFQSVKLQLFHLSSDKVTFWRFIDVTQWNFQGLKVDLSIGHMDKLTLSSLNDLTHGKFQFVQLKLWNCSNRQIDTVKSHQIDTMQLLIVVIEIYQFVTLANWNFQISTIWQLASFNLYNWNFWICSNRQIDIVKLPRLDQLQILICELATFQCVQSTTWNFQVSTIWPIATFNFVKLTLWNPSNRQIENFNVSNRQLETFKFPGFDKLQLSIWVKLILWNLSNRQIETFKLSNRRFETFKFPGFDRLQLSIFVKLKSWNPSNCQIADFRFHRCDKLNLSICPLDTLEFARSTNWHFDVSTIWSIETFNLWNWNFSIGQFDQLILSSFLAFTNRMLQFLPNWHCGMCPIDQLNYFKFQRFHQS